MSVRTGLLVRALACLLFMCAAAVPFAAAQIKIINPEKVGVPADTAQLLLRLSCKVAAEQFHVASAESEFPLTLVIGRNETEHYTADDANRSYTVYLQRWDESRFTAATTMIAVRRLALPVQKKMMTEILHRAHAIAPVRMEDLSGEKGKLR